MVDLMEATESLGFWILGGAGTAMVLVGWILSKSWEMASMPIWQLLIMILGIWVASAFFASRGD